MTKKTRLVRAMVEVLEQRIFLSTTGLSTYANLPTSSAADDLAIASQVAASTSTVDNVVFGDTASEAGHALATASSQVIAGALNQTARQLLPLGTVGVNGGYLTITMAVDPVARNYFTVKLWGGDDTDSGKGRLYLYVPVNGVDYQVGYRHEGDYAPLSVTASKPSLAGRFLYSTTLLPLSMTQGKTSITLKIVSTGELYGLGSPSGTTGGNYQFNMDTPSRGVYGAYTHTQAMLDVSGETQGAAPSTTLAPATTAASVLGPTGTYTTGLNNWINGRLGAAVTAFTTSDVQMFAQSYVTPQLVGYQNSAVINKAIAVIDGFATDYYANPTSSPGASTYGGAGGNEVWGGRFGLLGWAIHLLSSSSEFQSQLNTVVSYGVAGGSKSRRAAWGDMLLASREFGRFNRDGKYLTNQSILSDANIYKANRGLLDLGDARAFTETAAQRYLKESAGLLPWLGSDLAAGGSSLKYGSNYYLVTDRGLTREWGYAGGYGEMAVHIAQFYRWTGNTAFKDQAIKMVKAMSYFRRPAIEVSGANNYRSMEREGVIAWRGVREADGYVSNDVAYGGPSGFSAGMIVAAATLDPTAIGYAKQMLNDNQYLNNLTADARFYSSLSFDSLYAIDAFADYDTVVAAADSGARLPMTSGHPDFAWSDEQDGVVVIKQGENRLYIEPYWQAKTGTGINGIGRFDYTTTTYEQYGQFESNVQYTSNGAYFVRPNFVDMTEQTRFTPPDAPMQAYAGEQLPIGAAPGDSADDTPYRGKADFHGFRFGNYLIGVNTTAGNTYALKTPVGFTSATDLISGTARSGVVTVGANSTIVLNLPDAVDAAPVPTSPLLVKASGTGAQVTLNWSAASGATSYTVKRSAAGGGAYAAIASSITTTSYVDSTVNGGVAYDYVVAGVNANGESYNSAKASASAGLPSGWVSGDVGAVSLPGSTSVNGSTFTVRGSGGDVGVSADSFQFVYKSLAGDGTITARVLNAGYTNGADKVGVMLRDGLAAGAVRASLALTDANGSVSLNVRNTAGGGATTAGTLSTAGAPYWLRLIRTGSVFTASVSADGTNWTTVATSNITMGSSVYAGLFVCSRYSQQVNATMFDNVLVKPAINAGPTVAVAAAAGTAGLKIVGLSVLGDDDGGEAALAYTWLATGPAAVSFSANGTNGAKNSVATFTKAGTYSFTATIADADGATITSGPVSVVVGQTLTSLSVSPATATVKTNATVQFTAAAFDQFGATMTTPANLAWSVASGVGTVSAGLYTAPGAAGSATVGAASGAVMAQAVVTIALAAPTAPTALTATAASASQINLAWVDASNNETAFELNRSTSITFAANLVATTLAPNATSYAATGLAAGTTYYFRVRASNAAGASANTSTASAVTRTSSVYQAESATLGGGTKIEKNYSGYTGTGFANLPKSNGYVDWSVQAAAAGTYTLSFRYALLPGSRNVQLQINGTTIAGGVTFQSTTSWSKWATVTLTVNLSAGLNHIRLTTIGQDSGNVDSLTVW